MTHYEQDAAQNVMATATDVPCSTMRDGEVIQSSGIWLGDFQSVEGVPFDYEYPVGWTNATWYETQGCFETRDGCSCDDCHGTHVGILFGQIEPPFSVTCATEDVFGEFDHSPNPPYCVTTLNGCDTLLGK